jgi:hypothetical protein
MYRIEHVLSQSVYHATFRRVIALFTLYFLVYDACIMILALPCNRGLSKRHKEERANAGCLEIRITCPSGAICLTADFCFGEQAL